MGSGASKPLITTLSVPTDEEKSIILDSWDELDKGTLGMDVFYCMLKEGETIRNIFRFSEQPLEKLKANDRFMKHSALLMKTVDGFLKYIKTLLINSFTSGVARGRGGETLC